MSDSSLGVDAGSAADNVVPYGEGWEGQGGGVGRMLDDTELNELGDVELEKVLEQMWMAVMGQVT